MLKYIFAEDEPLRIKAAGQADPQVIGEALEAIRVNAGGELEARRVVDVARDVKSVLHKHFEWDDKKAAESFRLDQARNVIRVVRVVDHTVEEGTSRAFLSVHGKDGISYRSIADVKGSADLQQALLAAAERDLKSFEARYDSLKDICAIVKKAREQVQKRRERAETTAPKGKRIAA